MQLSENEIHSTIINHYFKQLFPEWLETYQFPIAITSLITKYIAYDRLLFFDHNTSHLINLYDIFPNISSDYIINHHKYNGMFCLTSKNQDRFWMRSPMGIIKLIAIYIIYNPRFEMLFN